MFEAFVVGLLLVLVKVVNLKLGLLTELVLNQLMILLPSVLFLVFTKENETGDMYIEKLVEEVGKNYSVRVVTSDNLIRVSALRAGVLRMPAREFIKEIERVNDQIKEIIAENSAKRFYYKIQIPKE